MNELLELGQKILRDQPFSVLVGAELILLEKGKAAISLTIRQDLKQQHGFVHGGVISYLTDNCLAYAGGSVLADVVTSEFKINYLRPAIGEKLLAEASVLSSGRNQAVCECRVSIVNNEEKKLIAVAQGTVMRVSG